MNQALHAICFSRGIARQTFWQQVLGVSHVRYISPRNYRLAQSLALDKRLFAASQIDLADDYRSANTVVVDWGNKRQVIAEQYAQAMHLPQLRLEDGFIRSISATMVSDQHAIKPFSLIVDDMGVYYDAKQPSRLEYWLNGGTAASDVSSTCLPLSTADNTDLNLDDPAVLARARACIDLINDAHISKYNDLDDINLGPKKQYRLLLIDQVANDLSIAAGAASAATFDAMLDEAMSRFPDAEIVIKVHPVAIKKRGGHFNLHSVNLRLKAQPQFNGSVRLLAMPSNAISLIKQVDEVFVVSSQVGFEALMLGKKVSCFGLPFYAGWGLTHDKQAITRRHLRRSLEQVFAAAYFMYSHYRHPFTGQVCQLEAVLDFLQRQRNIFHNNRGVNLCLGFPPWKQAYLRRYLYSPWGSVTFLKTEHALLRRLASIHSEAIDLARADTDQPAIDDAVNTSAVIDNTVIDSTVRHHSVRILLWGDTAKTDTLRLRLAQANTVVQVEDGFIRSVGLGKYYIPPRALVFDSKGIYFNPKTESDLESILSTGDFSAEQLASAANVINLLTSSGITKYNVGGGDLPTAILAAKSSGQTIVLVPGQVEDDASIKAACEEPANDMALLERVRQLRVDALIIYKPHPDVVSGNCINRSTTNKAAQLSALADFVLTEIDMDSCLDIADEVHTMTSLTGFEAMIRGVKVFTYGMPFYAGWGLTVDHLTCPRRQRQLSVNELVAGVLLIYSRYIDYRSGYFINAEQALALIIQDKALACDRRQQAAGHGSAGASTIRPNAIYANKLQRFTLKLKNLMVSIWYGLRH